MENNLEQIFISPRNFCEREEIELIKNLYKYVYKDVRSKDEFCKLVFFYREEIAKRELLLLKEED